APPGDALRGRGRRVGAARARADRARRPAVRRPGGRRGRGAGHDGALRRRARAVRREARNLPGRAADGRGDGHRARGCAARHAPSPLASGTRPARRPRGGDREGLDRQVVPRDHAARASAARWGWLRRRARATSSYVAGQAGGAPLRLDGRMARGSRRPVAALFGRQALSRAALLLALAPAVARAGTAPPGFTAAPIIGGLQQPTAIAFAPDGRLFVLEKAGAVWTWTPGAGLSTAPILQVPSCTASEMGLTGVAVDPDFARNGFLYLYHAEPPGGDVARCDEGSAAGRRNQVLRV